jgi:hypothetical protein
MQTTFAALFREIGVEVIDIAPEVIDHSRHSHLTTDMNWSGYILGYLVPTFLDGGKILEYVARFQELEPDLVISDYNIIASAAAAISGVPHVLVTERYDFSLGQLDDETLAAAGFDVDTGDMARARQALRAVFKWIVEDASVVLTDKPYVAEIDDGTPVAAALRTGRAVFTGPMIRDLPQRVDPAQVRRSLGLGPGPRSEERRVGKECRSRWSPYH